jgi:hypothetical protein
MSLRKTWHLLQLVMGINGDDGPNCRGSPIIDIMDQVFFARQANRCQTRRLDAVAMQKARQQRVSQRNDREVARNSEFLFWKGPE